MITRPVAFALAGAVVLSNVAAAAQEPPSPYAAPPPVPPPPPAKYRNPTMRTTGIVFTALAAAELVAGAALMATGAVQYKNSPTGDYYGQGAGPYLSGVVLLGLSPLFAAIGIPLWVVGARPPKQGAAAGIPRWPLPRWRRVLAP